MSEIDTFTWKKNIYFIPPKNPQTINGEEYMERRELSYIVGGNVDWHSHYGEQYGGFFFFFFNFILFLNFT